MPAETRRHRRIADGTEKARGYAGVGGPADYILMHVPNNKGSDSAIKQLLLLSGSVVKRKPSEASRPKKQKRVWGHSSQAPNPLGKASSGKFFAMKTRRLSRGSVSFQDRCGAPSITMWTP